MIRTLFFIFLVSFFSVSIANAGFLDDIFQRITASAKDAPDNNTVISGLKEALSIGTEKAVENVSQPDGYFANEMTKILMPEKIQKVADLLKKVGFQKEVDDFVLSMNRAAEKAAPQAAEFFVDAVQEMTFEDAKEILHGGDTAATDFFRAKTHDNIHAAFKPVISSSMDEAGVAKAYKDMIGKYERFPVMKIESLDLDHYVTNKALDGLFYVVGQEEKKIRTDPAARVTDLLKTVFGK